MAATCPAAPRMHRAMASSTAHVPHSFCEAGRSGCVAISPTESRPAQPDASQRTARVRLARAALSSHWKPHASANGGPVPGPHYIQVCAQDSKGLAWPRAFARRGCRAARGAARGASPRAPGTLGSVARRASEAERIALLCAWSLSCRPASRRGVLRRLVGGGGQAWSAPRARCCVAWFFRAPREAKIRLLPNSLFG